MAFVPASNIVMGEIRMLQALQHIENRWMFHRIGASVADDCAAVAALLLTWAEDEYFPFLTSTVTLSQVVVTDMSSQNGPQVILDPPTTVEGGLGNNPMPNEVAYCVSLQTASRGRSARGRTYIPGLDKGIVSANNVTGPYRANVTGAIQALIDVMDAAGYPMQIVSYISNKVPRPGGPVNFEVLTASTVDDVVDSMKRRKPGVGT